MDRTREEKIGEFVFWLLLFVKWLIVLFILHRGFVEVDLFRFSRMECVGICSNLLIMSRILCMMDGGRRLNRGMQVRQKKRSEETQVDHLGDLRLRRKLPALRFDSSRQQAAFRSKTQSDNRGDRGGNSDFFVGVELFLFLVFMGAGFNVLFERGPAWGNLFAKFGFDFWRRGTFLHFLIQFLQKENFLLL